MKLSKIKLDNYMPLRDVIYNTLRDAIVSGDLKPGERLMEVTLAEKMGVSRTPVREAVRKLELEGLVTMIPRKGTHVAELSVKDIMDVLEVRTALDKLATELAAERIRQDNFRHLENIHKQYISYLKKENLQGAIKKDVEFHEVIYDASGNNKLKSVAANLREQIYRFRVLYMKDFSNAEDVLTEHEQILKALEENNPKEAGRLAAEHIIRQQQTIIQRVEKG
ncbi:MAG: GntR family transcriptional regulator [Clostridiaceae bacterium]|jgi:DNA-binding GntR family transcriptional regulator|nr:GntR family transcriptional regulator [Clostridiaceae bacterium]